MFLTILVQFLSCCIIRSDLIQKRYMWMGVCVWQSVCVNMLGRAGHKSQLKLSGFVL